MILMQAHARTERVAVAGLEKMLHKVRWALGEVSLYIPGAAPAQRRVQQREPRVHRRGHRCAFRYTRPRVHGMHVLSRYGTKRRMACPQVFSTLTNFPVFF